MPKSNKTKRIESHLMPEVINELKALAGKVNRSLKNYIETVLIDHVMDFTKSSREHFISTQEVTFLKFEKSLEKVRYTKESAELIAKDIFKLGRNLKALFE